MRSIIQLNLIILFTAFLFSCTREELHETGNLVAPTTEEDASLPQLSINGVTLHLETFGDIRKPIMIFLHGGPGSDYRAMISEEGIENASRYPGKRKHSGLGLASLQDDFFLVFYDRRGSGLSPRFDPGNIKFDDQLDDLHAIAKFFLEEKSSQGASPDSQVYLFGHSFGGYLATAFANDYPELVKDLILYEPRPFNQKIFDLMTITSPFEQLTEDYVDAIFSGSTYVVHVDHESADYQWMVGATGNFYPEFTNPEAMPLWRIGYVANQEIERDIRNPERDVVSKLSDFEGKTLYLYGSFTKEKAIKPNFIPSVLSYFSQAESIIIQGAGHFGPWDKPAAIVAAIREFING